MDGENQDQHKNPAFESLDILISRWKDGTFGEIIDDWKWIFTYSARYKGAIVFYIILGIFSTSMGLVSSVASKYMIDIITGHDSSRLWVMVAIMVGSTVFSLVFGSVISRITAKLSIDINNDIQADIFDKIVDADWLALNQYSNGDILNRFNGDIGTVSSNAISWLPTIIIAVYNFIATFFVILHYDWIMAVIALGSAPFMLLMSRFMIRKQRDYSKKVREMSSELMTFEVEAIYNFDTIKSFGVAPHYSKKMRWWQGKFRDISLKYNLFSIKTSILMTIMGTLVQFAAFGYCLFRLWTGDITYGTMTLFLQQRSNLSSAFSNVVSIIPSFLNSSVSAHRIRELVQLPREVHIPESGEMDKYADQGFEVRMEGVTFSYLEGNRVITDSSFEANPGEIVALVGPSGSGKSTCAKLAARLWDIDEGTIKVGGVDISTVDPEVLLTDYSVVFQDVVLFDDTVMENIRLGKHGASDEEVLAAAKAANCDEFVERLPEGYNTSIGENGAKLSGGERQRISIARALLKDAPIILLDEATASLDVENETKVQGALSRLLRGKTVLVIAHRMRTVEAADKIIVLKEGRVAEEGTPADLMKKGGIFARMVELQKQSAGWKLK